MSTTYEKHGYDPRRGARALELLMVNRHEELRELATVIFARLPPGLGPVTGWETFVLNFTLEVEEQFKIWSNEEPVNYNSANMTLTILRQLGANGTTMNHITHMLNLSYTIAKEFKSIYRRTD